MKAYVGNAADESQVKDAKRKERYRRERELLDVRAVLQTKEGRSVFWRLLTAAGIYQTSFSESKTRTFFNEGQRNLGLMLLTDINEADPQGYLMMMTEQKKEEVNHA